MDDDAVNAVAKVKREYGKTLHKVSSPYLTKEEFAQQSDVGIFAGSCASPVATLLFLGRVARRDISVAVQRLCRVVTKWTTTHDAAMVQLFAYIDSARPLAFFLS